MSDKKYETAKAAFEKAIAANKKDIDAYLEYAQILMALKEHDEATEVYDDAVEIEERAAIYFLRGRAYQKVHEDEHDEDANTYDNHEDDFVENGAYDAYLSAKRSFEKAVELEPENVQYNCTIGKWMMEVGDRFHGNQGRMMFVYLYKAIELDPTFAEARICLGNRCFEHREYDKALEHFQQAAKSTSNDENLLKNIRICESAVKRNSKDN